MKITLLTKIFQLITQFYLRIKIDTPTNNIDYPTAYNIIFIF